MFWGRRSGPLVVERRALSPARLLLGCRWVERSRALRRAGRRRHARARLGPQLDEAYGSYDTPRARRSAARRLDPNYAARLPPVAPPAPPATRRAAAGPLRARALARHGSLGRLQRPPRRGTTRSRPGRVRHGRAVDMRGDRLRRRSAYGPVARVSLYRYGTRSAARGPPLWFLGTPNPWAGRCARTLRVDGARLACASSATAAQQAAAGERCWRQNAGAGRCRFSGFCRWCAGVCGDAEIKAVKCYGQVSRAWSFPANGSGDGGRARCAFVVFSGLSRRGSRRRARAEVAAGRAGAAGGAARRAPGH